MHVGRTSGSGDASTSEYDRSTGETQRVANVATLQKCLEYDHAGQCASVECGERGRRLQLSGVGSVAPCKRQIEGNFDEGAESNINQSIPECPTLSNILVMQKILNFLKQEVVDALVVKLRFGNVDPGAWKVVRQFLGELSPNEAHSSMYLIQHEGFKLRQNEVRGKGKI